MSYQEQSPFSSQPITGDGSAHDPNLAFNSNNPSSPEPARYTSGAPLKTPQYVRMPSSSSSFQGSTSPPPHFNQNTLPLRHSGSVPAGLHEMDIESEKEMLRLQRQSMVDLSGVGVLDKDGRPAMARDLSDFDLANGRSKKQLLKAKGHISQQGEQIPVRWSHLFKRPLIRQWLHNGKLYHEEEEREPSRFELFFDLSFVGIIHLLAEGAAESATSFNVAKFILLFHPAWSVWLDVRHFINTSGVDDVWQRLYILLMMILLSGYAANATGIQAKEFGVAAYAAQLAGQLVSPGTDSHTGEAGSGFGSGSGSGSGIGAGAHGEAGSAGGEHRRAIMDLVLRAAKAGGEGEVALPPLSQYIGSGYYYLDGYQQALRSATAFYLVAKAVRLALFLLYGAVLPKFRKALWLNGLALVLITAINIPLLFVSNPSAIIVLWTTGFTADIVSRYCIAFGLQFIHGRQKHQGQTSYIPAASVEHTMERMTLFAILVFGEVILVSHFTAAQETFGLSAQFLRSALAIGIGFFSIWLLFDADAARVYVHALRRNWFTSISFTTIHLPLFASIILMSSALHKIMAEDEVPKGYQWYFSGSLAVTVLCIAIIGMLHHQLDQHRSALIPHHVRISGRILASILIACIPQKEHWTSTAFLAAHCGVLALLVVSETVGKVGAVGKHYDHEKASDLRAARAAYGSGSSSNMDPDSIEGQKTGSQDVPVDSSASIAQSPTSVRDRLFYRMRRLNKDWAVRAPNRADWHEYEALSAAERGDDDVGMATELGKMQVKEVSSGQRWAYAV
ncbi:hypothetical protein OC844_007470 [Tilletia horrida]|nr:hypothetical protein OC844_007470 [Tilletia horrida]